MGIGSSDATIACVPSKQCGALARPSRDADLAQNRAAPHRGKRVLSIGAWTIPARVARADRADARVAARLASYGYSAVYRQATSNVGVLQELLHMRNTPQMPTPFLREEVP